MPIHKNKTTNVIDDFSDFSVKFIYGTKPLAADDPAVLKLIRKAISRNLRSTSNE